jgi:hypothetical protein
MFMMDTMIFVFRQRKLILVLLDGLAQPQPEATKPMRQARQRGGLPG